MRDFEVKFLSRSGVEESRTIRAGSENEIALQLIASGATPLHIREHGSGWLERLSRPVRSVTRIKLLDLALFAEQFGEMLKAGVTVEQALVMLARDSGRSQIAALAGRLLSKVRAGSALSFALSEEPSIPKFFSGLVRGSERSGKLAEGLAYLGDYLMRQDATRSKIISTLTYPAIVVVTSIFAFLFVLVMVIPEFAPLFAGEESKLPVVTRIVLWLSDLVTTNFLPLLIIIFGAPAAVWAIARRVTKVRHSIAAIAARFPPVEMVNRLDIAKTLRVLGALLAAGVEVSEAITFSQESAMSGQLKLSLLQAARQVREGNIFSDAMRAIETIPDSVCSLIAIGERTGELGAATMRAAGLLEMETNRRVDQLISLLNPIAVVVLGVMIAFLISGVMLGILSANQFALR